MRLSRVVLESERLVEVAGDANGAPPIAPGKIVAIGLNYVDHIRETGIDPPAQPLVFAKFPSTVVGEGASIVIDAGLTARERGCPRQGIPG